MSFNFNVKCPNCGNDFQDSRSEIHPDTKLSCPKCTLRFTLTGESYRAVCEYIEQIKKAIADGRKAGGGE